MEFIKPEFFNGKTFEKELAAAKIKIKNFYDNGAGKLIVDADDKFKDAIQSVLNSHDGSDTPMTTLEKLELAGVNLDELRIALGL